MSDTKHTPAPWTVSKNTPTFIEATHHKVDSVIIAQTVEMQGSASWLEAKANAHLIAAAPDLLAACESALTQLQLIGAVNSTRSIRKREIVSDLSLEALMDAIDKAKGETKQSEYPHLPGGSEWTEATG